MRSELCFLKKKIRWSKITKSKKTDSIGPSRSPILLDQSNKLFLTLRELSFTFSWVVFDFHAAQLLPYQLVENYSDLKWTLMFAFSGDRLHRGELLRKFLFQEKASFVNKPLRHGSLSTLLEYAFQFMFLRWESGPKQYGVPSIKR